MSLAYEIVFISVLVLVILVLAYAMMSGVEKLNRKEP
jgi:hypothetical protein